MPSLGGRMAKVFVRLDSLLMLGGHVPVAYQRFLFSQVVPRLAKKAEGVRSEPAAVPGMPARWLVPDACDEGKAILYLHGGGYVIGSMRSHQAMASRVAAASRSRALIVDYRLAPENRFPAAVEDAASAYRWLMKQGYEPRKIAIAGDSAGGGLTAATLVYLRDAGDPLPACAMMLSPWADLAMSGESCKTVGRRDPMLRPYALRKWAAMYLGGADAAEPLASPIHADLRGLPPLLIQAGTEELLLDDARRLAARAEECGVQVELDVCEGMFHVYQFFSPLVRESREAVDGLGRFFQERTSG